MKQMALAVAVGCPIAIAAMLAHAAPVFTTSVSVHGVAADDRHVGFTRNRASLTFGSVDTSSAVADPSASTNLLRESVVPDAQTASGSLGAVVAGSDGAHGGVAGGTVYSAAPNSDTIYVIAKDGTQQPFVTLPDESVRKIVVESRHTDGGDMLVATGSGNIYRVTADGHASLLAADGGGAGDLDAGGGVPTLFGGGMSVPFDGGSLVDGIGPTGIVTGFAFGTQNAVTAAAAPLDFVSSGPTTEGYLGSNASYQIGAAGYSQSFSSGGAPALGGELGGDLSQGWLPTDSSAGAGVGARAEAGTAPSWSVGREDVFTVTLRLIADWISKPANIVLAGTGLLVVGGLGSLRRRN